jgi:tRNA(fMet)-specific endonuclease VapC
MHLLDTDTLTFYFADHVKVVRAYRLMADDEVGTTVVTRIEMLRGRFDHLLKAATGAEVLRAQELLTKAETDLVRVKTMPFDSRALTVFESLRRLKNLKRIGRADMLIASIALANRAVLVTRNLRHFRLVPNLQLANWVD